MSFALAQTVVVSNVPANPGGALSAQLASNVAVGDLVVVPVYTYNSNDDLFTSFTDSLGNTFTRRQYSPTPTGMGSPERCVVYDCVVTNAGAMAISIGHTFGTAPRANICHYTKSGPGFSVLVTTSSGAGAPSGTLNDVPANSLMFGAVVTNGDVAAPGGYTEFRSANGWNWEQGVYLLDSGAAGNQTMTWGGSIAHTGVMIAYSDAASSSDPEVTSVTPDTDLTNGQTGIFIAGSGFSASGNTVLISPTDDPEDEDAVTQTITAEGEEEITFTVVRGGLPEGQTLYLFVVNDDDAVNADGYEVEFDIVATMLAITAQPGNTVVGQTMAAITVEARNAADALDVDFDGDVTVALQTGDGTLAGTLTQAAVAGVATFDDLSINTLNTDAVLRFTSDGLTQADSDEFDITAGTGSGVGGSLIGSALVS